MVQQCFHFFHFLYFSKFHVRVFFFSKEVVLNFVRKLFQFLEEKTVKCLFLFKKKFTVYLELHRQTFIQFI